MVKVNQTNTDCTRRKFLKGGALLATTLGLSTVTGVKSTEKVVKAFGKKEQEGFPYEIATDFKRYDQNRTVFMRVYGAKGGDTTIAERIANFPNYFALPGDDSRPGFTNLDAALKDGAAAVVRDFAGGSDIGEPNTPMYTWEEKPREDDEFRYKFGSKEDASQAIKKAAKFYGASLVGITAYDEKWVYNPLYTIKDEEGNLKDILDTDFPFKPKSVIVIAVEMDYEGISTAPSPLGNAAVMLGYSKMPEVTHKLSTFIRRLGYNAFGAGNDVAESIPYAIAAGLGEEGRNGLLITYEYGPRVRLCKVFTDMELACDKPIKFGANQFCKVCKKCAHSCPSQSISLEDEMTWQGETEVISNHTGVLKYYINPETCYIYWKEIGNDCAVCITSCPFNKPDFWHHRLTTALTATPLKPFLNEMDDLFGYGNIYDEQACIDFWDLDYYTK